MIGKVLAKAFIIISAGRVMINFDDVGSAVLIALHIGQRNVTQQSRVIPIDGANRQLRVWKLTPCGAVIVGPPVLAARESQKSSGIQQFR